MFVVRGWVAESVVFCRGNAFLVELSDFVSVVTKHTTVSVDIVAYNVVDTSVDVGNVEPVVGVGGSHC